jgi:hypothetical protein
MAMRRCMHRLKLLLVRLLTRLLPSNYKFVIC